MKYTFSLGSDKKVRLDKFLSQNLTTGTRTHIQKLIKKGRVTVSGETITDSSYSLRQGERIEIQYEEPMRIELAPESIEFEVIYEDEHIIVINKPAGLVVHPGSGIHSHTLVNALLHHTKQLSSINRKRPGIVHRLDRQTTGVMVIAKNNTAQKDLAAQFKNHQIKKTYIAIVEGRLAYDEDIIELPIARSLKHRERMQVDLSRGKDAKTRYKVLERIDSATLVQINLLTGRTHQVRVHFSHINHPVWGDPRYGDKNKHPFCLHAFKLGLTHPVSRKYLEFEAKSPYDMIELLKRLKNQKHD